MADNLKATGQTNPDPNTCVDAQCSCDIIWSLAQQFSMRQLVTGSVVNEGTLDYREDQKHVSGAQIKKQAPQFVDNPERRARRIAAAYARVYREKFNLGDKKKEGRFYWLALGAFASKQVAATLALWQVKYGARYTELRAGLGRGNLWLFNDVLAWFYVYAVGSDTFDKCSKARDSRQFVDQVATNFKRQLGYEESIAKVPYSVDGVTGAKFQKLGFLKCTKIISDGFRLVTQWEDDGGEGRKDIAFAHLLKIAQHEQGEVLQGLIYDDVDFQRWLNLQSFSEKIPVVRALVPNLELVLTSEYKTNSWDFKSLPEDGMVLQDYRKRMVWITAAAKKFDDLMHGNSRAVMLGYLDDMIEWGNEPD